MEKIRKACLLFGIAISLAMIFIDQSGTAVTLVAMSKSLHLSIVEMQWVVNAFLLTIAALLILGGRLGDYIGYKNVYIWGHVIFVLSSILVGCAQNAWMVLLGRVLQGVGASIMIPGNITLASLHFDEKSRGKVIGLIGATGSFFLAAAPIVAGAFTQYLSWRWLFWLNVPLAVIAVIMIAVFCPNDPKLPKGRKLDFNGLCLLVAFLFCSVFALMQAVNWGWGSAPIITLFALALLSFILFIIVELKTKDPFVHLTIFKNWDFTVCNIALFMTNINLISQVFWVLWLQHSLGLTPFMTGIALIPAFAATFVLAIIGGWLTDILGVRVPLLIGSTFLLLSLTWIWIASQYHSYWLIFPGFLMYGLGAPFIFTSTLTGSMNAIAPKLRGLASGMANTMRQVGSAIGLAGIGAVIAGYMRSHSNTHSTGVLKTGYSQAFFYGMIIAVAAALICWLAALVYWRHTSASKKI